MRPFDVPLEFLDVSQFELQSGAPPLASKGELRLLARLLDWGGLPFPVIVDRNGAVLAGAARIEAMRLLGGHTVPVARAEALSRAELDAFIAADARLERLAGWGEHLLALDRRSFDPAARAIEMPRPAPPAQEPKAPKTRCSDGEIWRLGPHRLMCGDALDMGHVSALVGAEQVDLALLDPPQNLFHKTRRETYLSELAGFAVAAHLHLRDGAWLVVTLDWRNLKNWESMPRVLDCSLREFCVWTGASAPPGALYEGAARFIAFLRKGATPHMQNADVSAPPRSNWLAHPADARQPSALPPAALAELMRDTTPAGAFVLDLCAGAGFTLWAAQETGRVGLLMERDPVRCDSILARFAAEFDVTVERDEGATQRLARRRARYEPA